MKRLMARVGLYTLLLDRVRVFLRIPYTLHLKVVREVAHPKSTYVFVHGIGNTLHSWDEVYESLPGDVRVVGVDLLGFGGSPKPSGVTYNTRLQARSLMRTLARNGLMGRSILVGHSLGALVAVEMARRYPLFLKRIILCSPPLYKQDASRGMDRERILKSIYRNVQKYPDQLRVLSAVAAKAGIANKTLSVTEDTVGAYLDSLSSSIMTQSALKDITRLRMPVTIFYGTFDPLVIGSNIRSVVDDDGRVVVRRVPFGHEVVGGYAKQVAEYLSVL